MTKFYVIMKYTFESIAHKKEWVKNPYTKCKSECVTDSPDNHFPSMRIKMHELNKNEANPLVLYRVQTTNY